MFDRIKKLLGNVWPAAKTAGRAAIHTLKWVLLFLVLAMASLGVLFWAFWSRGFFHELTKFAIEKYLGNYTRTEVRVDRVEGPLFTGIDIYGFAIGDGPSVAENGCAVTVDEIHARYNPLRFFARDFTVDEVYLVHPQCMLKRDEETGRVNLARIFEPKKKKKGRGSYFTIERVEMDDAFFIMFLDSPIYRFEDAHIETRFVKARGAVFLELGDCSVYLPHFNQWVPSFGNGEMAINAQRIRMDDLKVQTPTTRIVTDGIIKMHKGRRTELDLSFVVNPLDLGEVSQGVFDEPLPVFGTGEYEGRLYGPTDDLVQEGRLTVRDGYLYGFKWTDLSAGYSYYINDRYLSINDVAGALDGVPVSLQMDMFFGRDAPPEYYGVCAVSDANLGKYVRTGFLDSDVDAFIEFSGTGLSGDNYSVRCTAELLPGRVGPFRFDAGAADFVYGPGGVKLDLVKLSIGGGTLEVAGEAGPREVNIAVNALDVPLRQVDLGKGLAAVDGTFSFEGNVAGDNRFPTFDGGFILEGFQYPPVRLGIVRVEGTWKEYGRSDEVDLRAMFWDGEVVGLALESGRADVTVADGLLTARGGRINIDETSFIDFALDYSSRKKLLAVTRIEVLYPGGLARLDRPIYVDASRGGYKLSGGKLVSGEAYLSVTGEYRPASGRYILDARAGGIRLGDVVPPREDFTVDGLLTEVALSGAGTLDRPRLEGALRADDITINEEYVKYIEGTGSYSSGTLNIEKLVVATYGGSITVDGTYPLGRVPGPSREPFQVRVNFDGCDARLVNIASGSPIIDAGSIDGTVTLGGDDAREEVKGVLTLGDVQHGNTRFAKGRIDFVYDAGGLLIREASLSEVNQPNVLVHGTLPVNIEAALKKEEAFGGEMDLDVALYGLSLTTANLFTDEVLVTGGEVHGNAAISGTYERPRFQGRFTVKGGAGFIQLLRSNIAVLNGTVSWEDNTLVLGGPEDPIVCSVDEGTATVYGRIVLGGADEDNLKIHAELKDYVVKALSGIRAKGNIRVDATGPVSRPTVVANMEVDNALIVIPFGGEMETTSYSNVAPEAFDYKATITGDGGIWLRNDNADIEFAVDLVVRREAGRTVYMGELSAVRGHYYFLQRKFNIRHAYINFVGSEELNPRLDILASILIRGEESDAEVLIEIKGTMREPELTLRSPEYPDLEQDQLMLMLALNVTWEDYQEMSGGDVASKETREYFEKYAFNEVSRLLQRETQIEVFKIETTGLTGTNPETAVEATVGEYVTPDLYVSYTGKYSEEHGIKEYGQSVGVEYRLYPGLYLYGETEKEEEQQEYRIGLKFIHKY